VHQLAEPYESLVAAALSDLEVLERIDQEGMVGGRRENLACRRGVHEHDLSVWLRTYAPAPGNGAAFEMKLSRETAISQPQQDHPASSAEMLAHDRKHVRRNTQDRWHEPKYQCKKLPLHERVNPDLNYTEGALAGLLDCQSRIPPPSARTCRMILLRQVNRWYCMISLAMDHLCSNNTMSDHSISNDVSSDEKCQVRDAPFGPAAFAIRICDLGLIPICRGMPECRS